MIEDRRLCAVIGAGLLVCLPGCASIVSGRHADVSFYSNVPGAQVTIHDKRGKQVAVTQTPSTIALKRKDRIIFPAKYTATITAPGYEAAQVPINSKVNPWVFGNVLFLQGGLVGLAVDNATGAAWMPKESTIYQELAPYSGPQFSQTEPAPQSPSVATEPAPADAPLHIASPAVVAPATAVY